MFYGYDWFRTGVHLVGCARSLGWIWGLGYSEGGVAYLRGEVRDVAFA